MPATQPARGMRDFLPDDVRRRAYVIGVIAAVYERYGFEPLETPSVENLATLTGKYGEEGDRLIFKILKRGEEGRTGEADLALRYDLTVPLARVVAEYRSRLPRFFKRYQIQPVWRADRPQRGRFREFYQCDVDAIGSRSPVVESELCAAAADALARLGFEHFTIRLNHRAVLGGILEAAGVPPHLGGEALVALDKLDKVGRDGVARELEARGVPAEAGSRLLAFFAASEVTGDDRAQPAGPTPAGRAVDDATTRAVREASAADPENGACLFRIERFVRPAFDARLGNPEVVHAAGAAAQAAALDALANLAQIVALCATGAAAGRIRVDPSLARGLSYYTGAIMEIAVPDLSGSLGGGGRYDDLVGMFLGEQVPACGFSLGLERILVVMDERGMFPEAARAAAADVMVTVWNAEARARALALARDLRAAGLRVDVYPEADKLGKQVKYAASRAVPCVVIEGDDEVASGEVTVKNLRTGEQRSVPRDAVAPHVRVYLDALTQTPWPS